eukprot:Opistho-2@20760
MASLVLTARCLAIVPTAPPAIASLADAHAPRDGLASSATIRALLTALVPTARARATVITALRATGSGCACAAGWMGTFCDQPCSTATYGPSCTSSCDCRNDAVCDRFTGACNCSAGWTGAHCERTCPSRTYGPDCISDCACRNGASCDRYTGLCECTSGWMNVTCETPCPDGS